MKTEPQVIELQPSTISKSGIGKLDVLIACPGLPFSGETFDKQSLGGSETA